MRVLYFSTVNWKWIKQRPHFEAYYLAQGKIKVEYLSLTPLFKQKKSRCKNINENLRINDKYVLPLASKLKAIDYINRIYINRMLNNQYDTIVLTHPKQYYYLNDMVRKRSKIIYECMDNMPYFYDGKVREHIIEDEKVLCNMCNHIIVSSDYLREKMMKLYHVDSSKITVIKNAVDYSVINQELKPIKIEHPNLMYIGTISEWLDVDVLKRYACKHPNHKIYLIGPIVDGMKYKLSDLSSNIILFGTIPHETIKSYILEGDVMLIPFKNNELIKAVDPVKMYEYLALNKPVVSSYWEELNCYKESELVSFYNDLNEFEAQINKSLGITMQKKPNFDFVHNNNWQVRVEEYIQILQNTKM